jgi:hypothetical protein
MIKEKPQNISQTAAPNNKEPDNQVKIKSEVKIEENNKLVKSASPSMSSLVSNVKSNKELDWNQEEVENWFKEKNINQDIINNLRPCDGKILHQTYEIMIDAPEFLFSSIAASDKKVSTRDIAIFAYELKKLFKK